LHEGAYLMAYREQYDIIQNDYEQMYSHLPDRSGGDVPDDGGGGGVRARGADHGRVRPDHHRWRHSPGGERVPAGYVPGMHVHAEIPLPSGNVADFDDWWHYFNNDTMPAFIALTEDREELEGLISGDMHDRIEEYRLYNRIDSLSATFIDNLEIDVDTDW